MDRRRRTAASTRLSFGPVARSSNSRHYQYMLIGLVALVVCLSWMGPTRRFLDARRLRRTLEALTLTKNKLQGKVNHKKKTLDQIHRDLDKLQTLHDTLLDQLTDAGHAQLFAQTDYHLEDAYLDRVQELQVEVERSAERQLNYRGLADIRNRKPLRVAIELENDQILTIELHPITLFPHAVNLFLELLGTDYYQNHSVLVRSAQVQVVPHDESAPPTILQRLAKSESNDEDYPIRKGSVVFVDRGPLFQILVKTPPPPSSSSSSTRHMTPFATLVDGHAWVNEFAKTHDVVRIRRVRLVEED